ncbi:hypothetical protein [Burkholderia gladioli]|uniref:hypothetical protein n=1 Tax=Burkholderia gladioli TaxID=28095 RepID=UPI00163FDD80|nr:hypothetical protein [Burkholderia gladioli]
MVGKAGLCEVLGWTRPKLDRRLDSDASFPIVKRGTRAGGWEFDPVAVQTYLLGYADSASRGDPDQPVQRSEPGSGRSRPGAITPPDNLGAAAYDGARYTVVPPPGVEPVAHSGEQTARQRRDMVQAEILEDKLRRDRGELVPAETMRQVLTTMLAHLGKGMDRLSDQLIEALSLPEADGIKIRAFTDDMRKTMVDELRVLLG